MPTWAKTCGKWLLAALGVGFIGLAVAVLMRAELLEQAIVRLLGDSGVPATLDVVRLGMNDALFERVRVGGQGELTIERIELGFSPIELWNGKLSSIIVNGFKTRVRIDESGWSLGDLDSLVGDTGTPKPALIWLRRVEIRDATLLFGLGEHAIPLQFEGVIEGVVPGQDLFETARVDGRLDLSTHGLSSGGLVQNLDVDLHADLEKRGDSIVLQVKAPFSLKAEQIAEGVLPLALSRVDLRASEPDSLPSLTLDGTGRAKTHGALRLQAAELPSLEVAWSAKSRAEQGARTYALERASVRAESWSRPGLSFRPFEVAVSDWAPGRDLVIELARSEVVVGSGSTVLEVQGLAGTVSLSGDRLSKYVLALGADKLRFGGQVLYANPLTFRGSASAAATAVNVAGNLVDPRESIEADIQIDFDRQTSTTELSLESSPKRFSEALQPAQLVPLLEGTLPRLDGVISARLNADFAPAGRTDLYVSLLDVAVGSEDMDVENVTGVVHIDRFDPVVLPSWQVLHFDGFRAEGGEVAAGPGLVAFSLDAASKLRVLHVDSELIGGTIRAGGEADLVSGTQHMEFILDSLDLSRLVAALEIEGLSATGEIGGTLPLAADGDELSVAAGRLAATTPGRIRYRPTGGLQLPGMSAEQSSLVESLLSDFHYEDLRLFVSGNPNDNLEVRMELKGRNPAVQSGRSVELNLNITGPAGRLIRGPLAMFRVPEQLTDRIVNGIRSQTARPTR